MPHTIKAHNKDLNSPFMEWFNHGRLWIVSILSFLLIFTALWFIDHKNNQAYYQTTRAETQTKLGAIRAHLEGALNSNIQTVYGLITSISVEPNMDQARFAQYVKPLLERDNQLRNIGGAPDMVISLMYPLEGNEAALGLNYLENEKQRSGAIIARDTGQLVLAGPINLLQGGQGFIGRIPVFIEKNGTDHFWGLVSAVIDTQKLYEAGGITNPDLDIDIAIFGHDTRFSDGSIFFGPNDIFTKQPATSLIELPYGAWQIAAIPKTGWPTKAKNASSFRIILFIVGLCIFIPVVWLAWLSNRHRDQELKIDALFQLSPIGITLTELSTGKFLMANPKFCQITGYSLTELCSMTHWEVSPKNGRSQYNKQLKKLKNKGYFEPFEDTYITKQGEHFPAATNGVLIKDSSGRELVWSYIENIKDKKQQEEKALENAKQLELVIQATQVGIWDWNIQTGELILNQRWAEIIGYNLEELGNITVQTWMNFYHPDDIEESGLLLADHWHGKSDSYIHETRLQHKNGHYVWVLDTGKVIEKFDDGKPKRMVGTHLDITDKKLAEKEVAQTNDSLAKQMKLIKIMVKTQSDFISQNGDTHNFTSLLNDLMSLAHCQQAFIGTIKSDHDAFTFVLNEYHHEGSSVKDAQYFNNINTEKYTTNSPRNLIIKTARLGSPIYINEYDEIKLQDLFPKEHTTPNNILLIPVKSHHNTIAIIGLINKEDRFDRELVQWLTPLINSVGQILEGIRNIEAKKKTELLLIEAKNEAEAAGNAKTEFLATMSHEIRTPMNGVLGMLNLLQKSDLNTEQNRKVEMARYSADTLLSIINDILDFTKIDSGKLELEKVSFNLRDLMDEVCQSLAIKSQEKNIELILDTSKLKHSHVISDPIRIRQVLINLLGNANKFTEKGDILVEARTKVIDKSLVFQCNITDTGIGIQKNIINHLFDSFTQADASTTRKFGGTGLGLSISKKICNIMNGNIWVTSEEGRGSCFSFEIPLINQQISEPIPLPDHFDSIKVLLIDPNKKTCDAFAKQLREWGNSITFYTDISEIDESNLALYAYDIIIIDHKIFEHSHQVVKSLINQSQQNKTKWVLMTDVNQKLSDTQIQSQGFHGCFAKPIITRDILNCLGLVNDHPCEPEPSSSSDEHKNLPAGTRILLVEDIPFNQEVASMLIAEMGVQCDIANHGQEAVDMTITKISEQSKYDIILMDCQMPILDGYDATRKIKHYCLEQSLDIPIIAMTANAMSGDQEKCLAAGMDDYLSKPIDEDKLFTMLKKWTEKH